MKQNDLCRLLEEVTGKPIRTPNDFEYLAACIRQRTKQPVSVSTLKRLFGYVPYTAAPRRSTLDILCQYVGYKDFASFEKSESGGGVIESNPLMAKCIRSAELKINQKITVLWNPDRKCTFQYLGNLQFKVTESINSKLCVGDTFACSLFVEGEPLYLENLSMKGLPGLTYVCGSQDGIRIMEEECPSRFP